jgi:uracil phosphoribosyltransferase
MASTSMSFPDSVVQSSHPLILHKITQMRKTGNTPKYLQQLMKEVSTFLCYEATASLRLEQCTVKTRVGSEQGQRIAERVGVVPVLRGGLGMVESMTEMVSNAQVWHLGIYRDKKSLLPIEYYNKLPKKVTVHTVFVLDPMPISGATAVAAMDILKAWGEALKPTGKTLRILFVCLVAAEAALKFITESHPDVTVHVGLIDRALDADGAASQPVMPGMGDIADRLFGTDPEDATPIVDEDGMDVNQDDM